MRIPSLFASFSVNEIGDIKAYIISLFKRMFSCTVEMPISGRQITPKSEHVPEPQIKFLILTVYCQL
jgi:hypothetical protein